MLKYEIKGDNLPVVICYPEQGQVIKTEKGAMSWMSPNMKMETKGGGIGKMFGRAFSGESMFQNTFTAVGGPGLIAFASSFPGSIIPFEVSPGNELIVQKSGFLASENTVELSMHFQKKFGAGLVGGEGFIMQKLSGKGIAFIEIDGAVVEYNLAPGQSMYIDTGYLAAMTIGCSMDIEQVEGLKNMFLGGEGFFNTKVTAGPNGGKIWLQSMPIYGTARAIAPYLTKK